MSYSLEQVQSRRILTRADGLHDEARRPVPNQHNEGDKIMSGKRHREVYDNAMVAHLWANQSQAHARNQQNNFYFRDSTIFSYGGHFPIAAIVERKGKKCVLMTTRGYSVTTNGHKGDVRRALQGSGLTVFHVHDVFEAKTNSAARQGEEYQKQIIDAAIVAKRAKALKKCRLRELESLVKEANAYAKFFGSRQKFKVPADFDLAKEKEKAERAAASEKMERAKLEARRAANLAIAKIEHAVRLEQWLSGENINTHAFHLADDHDNTRLRIVSREQPNDTIETSRGAECPLKHALRILPLIRSGNGFTPNGHTIHLGHFSVDAIDAEGNLTAGCHWIKRAEIERIADLVDQGVPVIDGSVVLVDDAYDKSEA